VLVAVYAGQDIILDSSVVTLKVPEQVEPPKHPWRRVKDWAAPSGTEYDNFEQRWQESSLDATSEPAELRSRMN